MRRSVEARPAAANATSTRERRWAVLRRDLLAAPPFALGLAGLGVAACLGRPDPIQVAADSVEDRIVPPGGRIVSAEALRRDGQTARASWEIEADMGWDRYADWVVSRLGEYHVAQRDAMSLRLTREREGDVYFLVIEPKTASPTISVAFEATPF